MIYGLVYPLVFLCLCRYTYKKSFFTCVAFHPYEMCVAVGDANGKIIIWWEQQLVLIGLCLLFYSHPHLA